MYWLLGKLLIVQTALAADVGGTTGGGSSVTLPNPLGANSFEDVLKNIINALTLIAIPVATLMIFIGAFQFLTAGGNPERVKKGKQTILYAVIGYAIILMAQGIVLIIKQVIGVTPS